MVNGDLFDWQDDGGLTKNVVHHFAILLTDVE